MCGIGVVEWLIPGVEERPEIDLNHRTKLWCLIHGAHAESDHSSQTEGQKKYQTLTRRTIEEVGQGLCLLRIIVCGCLVYGSPVFDYGLWVASSRSSSAGGQFWIIVCGSPILDHALWVASSGRHAVILSNFSLFLQQTTSPTRVENEETFTINRTHTWIPCYLTLQNGHQQNTYLLWYRSLPEVCDCCVFNELYKSWTQKAGWK